MTFDKVIIIQRQDPATEQWSYVMRLYASVNKSGGGQALNAGADQYRASLTFEVRYVRALENLKFNPQPYRIIYRGRKFKVADYDDFMERHLTVKLVGEFYE